MGAGEIERFLSDLAVSRKVAASTQNQAFNALLFLYLEALRMEVGRIEGVERAKRPERKGRRQEPGVTDLFNNAVNTDVSLLTHINVGVNGRAKNSDVDRRFQWHPRPPSNLTIGRKRSMVVHRHESWIPE